MSQITLSFEQEWIDAQRKKGVRVIRQLEKWISSEEGVSLKSSSGRGLTVELQPALREKFLADLAERLTADFGENDPWAHAIFSGDLTGLNVPTARKEAPRPTESKEEPLVGGSQKSGKKSDSDSPPEEDPSETLEDICNRVPIKHSRELEVYMRETASVIPMLQKMGIESSLWHQHLLMAVDAGYGRSEFLAALVRLYKAFGLVKGELDKKSVREFNLLPKGKENAADGYHVTWDNVLAAAEDMNRSNTRNGISKVVLYIDVSAWRSSLSTSEVKSHLRRLNALCGTFLVVFRIPFLEGHVLRETADALNDILNVRMLAVPPPPIDDMIDYARAELASSGFQIADNALGAFEQLVLHEKVDDSFFGYKTMDKVVQKVIYEKALANCRHKLENRVIGIDDLKVLSRAEVDDKPVAELEKMVGMKTVARRLKEVIVQIKTQQKLAKKGKKVARPAIHMVFTGNPGTGKTTGITSIMPRST